MEFTTKSAAGTQKLADKIIKKTLLKPRQGALVLALSGELGSGKTTFTQGLGEALEVKDKILSPTFVIQKRFKIYDLRFKNLYHIDYYRIEKPEELAELGFSEIIKEPSNLVVIEWAERAAEILPKETIWIEFKHMGGDEREIKLKM